MKNRAGMLKTPAEEKSVLVEGIVSSTLAYRKVDLNLRIYSYHDKYLAEMNGHRFPININQNDLSNLNKNMTEAASLLLKNLKKGEGKRDSELLMVFAREGYYAFRKVFKDENAVRAIRQLLNASPNTTIEIQSEEFFLPWELLYDGDPDVVRYENFWGYRYVISRRIIKDITSHGIPLPEIIIFDSPKVSLQTDDDLTYVKSQEEPFFTGLDREGKIYLSKLRSLDVKNPIEERKYFVQFCKMTEANISHFACHAYYDAQHPHHSYIRLTDKFEIVIRDIETLDFELFGFPLVFLNACESGYNSPLQTINFVNLFLNAGARGVIATETDVSDDLAAEFSRLFYEKFLKGEEAGCCLLEARKAFLVNDNPIGLIYGLYGDPFIKLVKQDIKHVVERI